MTSAVGEEVSETIGTETWSMVPLAKTCMQAVYCTICSGALVDEVMTTMAAPLLGKSVLGIATTCAPRISGKVVAQFTSGDVAPVLVVWVAPGPAAPVAVGAVGVTPQAARSNAS